MGSEAERFATPHLAAGALFVNDNGGLLLVRKTYGNRWDIPGGYVDTGESPAQACYRELVEELGVDRRPLRVLAIDWAPTDQDADKLLWIFDCGDLGIDEHRIRLPADELDGWAWFDLGDLDEYLIPRLARRLRWAYSARVDGRMVYLEHGEPALN